MDRRHAIIYGASGLALVALVVVYRRRKAAAAGADQAAAYGPVVVPGGVGLGGSGAGDGTAPLGGNTYNFTFGVPAPVTTPVTPGSGAVGAANGEPCSSTGDCQTGLSCCNGSCQPKGLKCKPPSTGGCTLSTDCPPGQVCSNKVCVAKNKGGGKTDCPPGHVWSKKLKRCLIPVDQGVPGSATSAPAPQQHTVGTLRSGPAAASPPLPPQPGVSTLGQTYRSGLSFPSAHPPPVVGVGA